MRKDLSYRFPPEFEDSAHFRPYKRERDFTERRRQEKHISRLTRVLKMLSGVNSAVVRIRQRREILTEACRLATSVGGYASAMVALIEPGTRTARPTAWAGSVDNQAAQQLTYSIGETPGEDASVIGRVLRTGASLVCNDLQSLEMGLAARASLYASRAFCASLSFSSKMSARSK